jgi:hypothetical protein
MNTNGACVCCDLEVCGIFWANKVATLSFRVSCVNGAAEPEKNTGQIPVRLKHKA